MFLGREIATERDFSEETAALIDKEVNRLVSEAYTRAKTLLMQNRPILDRIAQMLIEKETVDAEELEEIIRSSPVELAGVL